MDNWFSYKYICCVWLIIILYFIYNIIIHVLFIGFLGSFLIYRKYCIKSLLYLQSEPCLNGGICQDGINEYDCDCQGTGFEGQHCEINIDECASNPCVNNATCVDGINNYDCKCFAGFAGKNCQIDIAECSSAPSATTADSSGSETSTATDNGGSSGSSFEVVAAGEPPCKHDGLCFERSNMSLYQNSTLLSTLPEDVRMIFDREFDYANAAGFVCSCMPGYEGNI